MPTRSPDPKDPKKPPKPTAAERTIPMFGAQLEPKPEVAEDAQDEAKGERIPLEQDVDRMRERAFQVQSWTSAAFASVDAEGDTYRVSYSDGFYYVEVLRKEAFKPAYGYTGVFVHENNLLGLVTVLVQAARDHQKRKAPKGNVPDGKK